jgi:hypothetical protein
LDELKEIILGREFGRITDIEIGPVEMSMSFSFSKADMPANKTGTEQSHYYILIALDQDSYVFVPKHITLIVIN